MQHVRRLDGLAKGPTRTCFINPGKEICMSFQFQHTQKSGQPHYERTAITLTERPSQLRPKNWRSVACIKSWIQSY